MFAVVPIAIVGGVFIWSEIAVLGVPLIIVALLIVLVDAWINRPDDKPAARSQPRNNRQGY